MNFKFRKPKFRREKRLKGIFRILQGKRQMWLHDHIDRLKAAARHQDPKSLVPYGAKVYSQSDEDGIIREIFRRIGTTNRIFVEFGAGDGIQNNTLALLLGGWCGLWIEASGRAVRHINDSYREVIEDGCLKVVESFITRDNINDLIAAHIKEEEIDLLSVDIDGNDRYVFEAISCIRPRVVVMEYNAKFIPPLDFCISYDERHAWAGDDYQGASLKHLETHLARKGYCLVGCNLSGVNAFFVRKDLVADKFLEPYSAERHYEPARYYIEAINSGHAPSYASVAKILASSRKNN